MGNNIQNLTIIYTIGVCVFFILIGGFLFKNDTIIEYSPIITYLMWGFGVGFAASGSKIIIKLFLKKILPKEIRTELTQLKKIV
jgi:hypothetical protein